MAFKMTGSHHYGKNPLKQTNAENVNKIKEKAAKNDWEAGSTLQEGDYATYDQQAYDVKGNKRDFNAHEFTGPVIFNQHGRPYSEEEGTDKVVFWSGKSSSGTPASPAKHSVAQGQGMNHHHGFKVNIPKFGKAVGEAGKWVGKGVSKALDRVPKYKVKFNNSRHVPGFVKITRTN